MFEPENVSKKIDNLGRITLPKGIRRKFGLDDGVELEVYTGDIDGRRAVCLVKKEPVNEAE